MLVRVNTRRWETSIPRLMAGVRFVSAFFAIFPNIGFVEGFLGMDVECRPRKVLIPLDAPHYQYFPFYIETHRCSGRCATLSPKTHGCVAVTSNNISGNAFDVSTKTFKAVTIQNHTSCGCECVTKAEDCNKNQLFDKSTCSCTCKYGDQPPTPCPERFGWDPFRCDCLCRGPVQFCSAKKEWSHQACGCVCTQLAVEECKSQDKYLNATTCECETVTPTNQNGPGVTGRRSSEVTDWRRILAVMVAELIVLVFLFDLYLFWRYGKGVIHWIIEKCHRSSKAATNENASGANANKDVPDEITSTSNGSEHHRRMMSRSRESVV